MTKWTREKIDEEYKNGRRNFSREDFSGLDLRDLLLTRADLAWADLTGTYLTGADMIDADLRGAILTGANLTRVNLTGANLTRVNLTDADLSWANLEGANLRGADLAWADLTGTYLTGAILTGANIDCSDWPLWCGSLDVKVDKRIAVQLCYHFCALDCDEPEYQEARAKVLDFANLMHRTDVERLE